MSAHFRECFQIRANLYSWDYDVKRGGIKQQLQNIWIDSVNHHKLLDFNIHTSVFQVFSCQNFLKYCFCP